MSDANRLIVTIDAATADVDEPASLATQIPPASSFSTRTRVEVLPKAQRPGGVFQRLLRGGTVSVPKDARCTALLVRGYVEIGADGEADDASVWGFSS